MTRRTGAALLLALAVAVAGEAQELRAVWVDAFHEGIRSPKEADDLLATAKRANLNTLIVHVRRRGDALYSKGIEPPLDDPAYDPAFDALAYIVEAGHRGGLKVHAWIERRERGWLGGVVRGTASGDHDGAVVKVKRKRFWPFARETRSRADGNGYYGLANVKPGRYEVSTTIAGAKRKTIVIVAAGRVTSAPLD